MKITILGSCAGTEPMPGRQHTSLVVQHAGNVYWIDAGEGCARTAHLMGIDLLNVPAIFITHPHMDHVGGLANLLWTFRKLNSRRPERPLDNQPIRLLMPELRIWEGVQVLLGGPNLFDTGLTIEAVHYQDGHIFDDGNLRVQALHNLHMGQPAGDNGWMSYSLRIEADDQTVVISGDVGDIRDVEPILPNCDLLLMETGHHQVENVCRYIADRNDQIGHLAFYHHGRAILADPDGELAKARQILGDCVTITEDGMTLDVE